MSVWSPRDVVVMLANQPSPDLRLFGDDAPFICVLCNAHRPAELVSDEPTGEPDPVHWHMARCPYRLAVEMTFPARVAQGGAPTQEDE